MKFLTHFFFLVFISTLVVTSLQFSLFDVEEIANIQLVEEENEGSNLDAEILSLEYCEQEISPAIGGFENYDAIHFNELHAHKKYKNVYLSVPYSPPELT